MAVPASFARELCHPLPLLAVLVLALNDHWLKQARLLPAVITGKLSDVAGLFFFPLLLVALLRLGLWLAGRTVPARLLGALAVLATGLGFALAKCHRGVNAWLNDHWGAVVLDPSDLLALPMLGLCWLWLTRQATACAR